MEVTKDGSVRVVATKVPEASSTVVPDSCASESEAAAAMSKLTTFSLDLSEEEKRARSKVLFRDILYYALQAW